MSYFTSKRTFMFVAAFALLASSHVSAQQASPATNVNPHFGNMLAAQKEMHAAFGHISAAQQNNEFDFGGHANRAKNKLEEAAREIDAAVAYRQSHPNK